MTHTIDVNWRCLSFLSIYLYILIHFQKRYHYQKVHLTERSIIDTLTNINSTAKKMSENTKTEVTSTGILSNDIDHWLRWSVVTSTGKVSNESNDQIDHWLRWS